MVAPLAGAWIEICYQALVDRIGRVAPLAGAWIEIVTIGYRIRIRISRSPRGSVD